MEETTKTGKNTRFIVIGVTLLLIIGLYMLSKNTTDNGEGSPTSTTTNSTSTTTNGVIQGNGFTIEEIPIPTKVVETPKPIPDLDRQPVVYAGAFVSSEAKVAAAEKIKAFQNILKNDPRDFSSWISLGIYQKMAGDYNGAIISWTYASRLAPNDYISLANIGNLYAYFIHDNGQAEVYYKQAIKKGPTAVYLYAQLSEIYKDVFKDLDKARAIINEGLTKIPNDPLLLQIQASLK